MYFFLSCVQIFNDLKVQILSTQVRLSSLPRLTLGSWVVDPNYDTHLVVIVFYHRSEATTMESTHLIYPKKKKTVHENTL